MFGIKTKLVNWLNRIYCKSKLPVGLARPMTLAELQKLGLSRTQQYIYCLYYFDHFLPEELKAHRRYFTEENRGFGEDAFHAMWYLILEEFKPRNALEIGVYRGQIVSHWKLTSKLLGFECSVACVSPFTDAGDSVSTYNHTIDYLEDVRINHQHFGLPIPEICKHYSTDPEAIEFIKSRKWDLIYIDGNHNYEIVRKDWEVCSNAVDKGGLIILDDSALFTDFKPPRFATAGHPGPSKVANEIPEDLFKEIFHAGHNRVFQRL